ncbi:MAG: OmpA family protein [Thermodesulfobacteriota bacterium]
MRKPMRRLFFSLMALFILAGCVGEVPIEPPKRGFYNNEPFVITAAYDEVWSALIVAVEEYGWDVKNIDKEKGSIQLLTSYVFTPSFERYYRVYLEPRNNEIEKSKVRPYLRRISYYEKITPPPAPPNAQFVKEDLKIEVKSLSPSETQIKMNYKIMPYYDYKIGYLGTVRSKGYVEKKLIQRTNEVLTEGNAPPPPGPIEAEVRLTDIFFDFDKFDVRADAEPVLKESAEVLKKNPELTIVIEGYADTRGTDEYNLRLGQKRADTAKEYLVRQGISPTRIETLSKGETTKFAGGTTEEAYQLNRRAHFIPINPNSIPGARVLLKKHKETML